MRWGGAEDVLALIRPRQKRRRGGRTPKPGGSSLGHRGRDCGVSCRRSCFVSSSCRRRERLLQIHAQGSREGRVRRPFQDFGLIGACVSRALPMGWYEVGPLARWDWGEGDFRSWDLGSQRSAAGRDGREISDLRISNLRGQRSAGPAFKGEGVGEISDLGISDFEGRQTQRYRIGLLSKIPPGYELVRSLPVCPGCCQRDLRGRCDLVGPCRGRLAG